jgi:hypothetical protein
MMAAVPPPGGFIGGLGGLFAPDPNDQAALQRAALFQAGLATLAGAQQPGASLGGSLFSGLQAGAGALQQAQQNAFQSKRLKQQEEREDRLEKQETERIKVAQAEQARKDRENTQGYARRISSGLSNAKGRELDYLGLIQGSPEFRAVSQEYGIDPAGITTPEQAQALAQQLGSVGGLGVDPKETSLELKPIVGPDGKPRFVSEQDALGQQPYYQPPASTNINVGQTSEAERKDAALATRLQLALRDLSDVEQESPGASQPTVIEKGAGLLGETAANVVRDPQRRRANASQLDALDAALTLATGAAYTKNQLESLRTSYFPQIGDDEQTKADKRARFEAIVNVARIRAGRAAPMIDQAIPPRAGAAAESPSPRLKRNEDGSFTYTPLVP